MSKIEIGSLSAPIFDQLRYEMPNPKQILFYKSRARHTAYGGARGGGKSYAMRRKLVMLCMRYPNLSALLLRRTMQELRENHILPLQFALNGYAAYKKDERSFIFPNGSRLKLGYCDNDSDVMQYQGTEYDVIGFEEATNFKEDWIKFILTSLRSTRTDFMTRAYYTCNPGGPGHSYIKRLFVDRDFREREKPEDYYFIPAKVYDNRVLMDANPEYISALEALPEHKRRAHLDGDWDVYEGQVFEEFRDDPEHYKDRHYTHVIEPFEIPDTWTLYRSYDHGYAKPFSCAWWACDYDGRLYRILELYGCAQREENVGVKWSTSEIFAKISSYEREHRWLKGKKIYGVADPAIWASDGGISIAEVAESYGVYFEKGDNQRIAGWAQVHNRMMFDENGIPMMYIFNNCRGFIRTIPLLQYSKISVEDVDTSMEDHIADETRYMCMMHPITPKVRKSPKISEYDPLDTGKPGIYNTFSMKTL